MVTPPRAVKESREAGRPGHGGEARVRQMAKWSHDEDRNGDGDTGSREDSQEAMKSSTSEADSPESTTAMARTLLFPTKDEGAVKSPMRKNGSDKGTCQPGFPPVAFLLKTAWRSYTKESLTRGGRLLVPDNWMSWAMVVC